MNNTQLFRQFLSNKFKEGGKKYRDYRYNESTLPQNDSVEQYLNTPVGTHLIDNPMYTDEDITSNNTPIIDSNTPVSEVVEDKVTVLPEVIVQGVSPQRKAVAKALLDYSMNNQPEIANILVDSNAPTITDKLAVLSKEDTDKMAANIEDELLRQNIESNLINSHFNHFFVDDADTQKKQIQDLRFLRTMNNITAYGGDISGNMFETGGPFSWGMPAIPSLIIAQKLKKLFSREPEKKPRNAQTDRKKPNTSSTDKRSENIENQIYGFLPKDRSPYDVPFIPEKSILINGYTTSTNALDSLAKYAGIHNRTLQISEKPLQSKPKTRPVTKEEALGLSLRETKGGALPYSNDSRTSKDKEAKRAFYNANVFTAFQDIPATALVNDYHYNKTSQSVPPLLDAFQYYAQGDYNRGDPNHTADVKAAGKEAFQNPQIQRWWDTEGKYWFNGTYKNAGDDGGDNSMLQGELLNIGTQPVKLKANGGNLFYNGEDEDNIPNRLTYLTTEKDKYAHGGFKGNLYDGEGDSVNLMNIAADIGTDMIPIVGTIKDAYKFYQEPSLANAGWLALSATTDLLPFLKPIKALKATKAATKAAQAAENAQIAIIRNEAKKAAEKIAKLRNTPNINPRKVRRAQDQYATYLNMIPERVPQGWAIDRAAKDAQFNYLMKYQMPKVGGELIINTNQKMSDILQKALGGPLFNSRSPIENFQGGRQLPLVRY